MARMRISAFAKEVDRSSSEVIDCLEKLGIMGKKAMSSIEDDEQEKVKSAFAGKAKTQTSEQKVKREEEGPEQIKDDSNSSNAAAGSKPAQKKKKPNIIFVSNPHNSQSRPRTDRQGQGGRPSFQRDNQNRNMSTSGRPNTSQLIKPSVPRSQTHLLYQEDKREKKLSQQPVEKQQEKEVKNENIEVIKEVTNSPKLKENLQDNKQAQNRNNNSNRDSGNNSRDNGRAYEHRNEKNEKVNNKNNSFQSGPSRDQKGKNQFSGADAKKEGDFKKEDQHRGDQRHKNNDKHKKDQSYMNEDGFKGGKQVKLIKSKLEKPVEKKQEPKEEEKIKVITIPELLTIKELADKMKVQPAAIIKKLFLQGKVVTVNQEISYEQAEEIAVEYDILCEKEAVVDVIEELLKEGEEDESRMIQRPPVICVMGHVDHGKTSLLDAIRKTHVIDREAGGITQHIGAYVVNTGGRKITFLDTPGHEAFTAMRMRGASSTDIAILVVAADDGVMPQTVEAINHAKAAGIEIIVAVNKIDKPSANIDRVKQELAEYELIPEDWGGSTVFAPVSAKTGQGIDELLDMILLTADILELKADPKRKARGLVIEAELDKGRGPVATMLVQKGTLRVGDFIACGPCHGKVRAMIDDKGRRVKEAGPSTPVEILGLNDVPNAGEIFISPDNDKDAKQFAETFISQNRIKMLDDTKSRMSLDNLFDQIKTANLKELNLIVKADVQGSVEAVKESLMKLSNDEVLVKVIHGGVGAINESDVVLAGASNAIIIGFNVRPDTTAKGIADTEGVDIRLYNVIYKAIEDVEAAMKGLLDPIFEEKVIGHAEIRQIFKASGIGNIAGSYVLDGMFQRGSKIRIQRQGEQIYEGNLASLKRFKDDVKEVKAGFECGLVFDGFNDIQELDIVEAYIMVEVPR
ncbi:MAG: translation initiation factor IF-2 [Lachnospiraceae bacterium]|nr:translation initiation factor IF-2 [Lachnospiraceae bacterium]